MISATSLNTPGSLNKGHQIPLGLENSRLRMDSQNFLIPSLPVSARPPGGGSHQSGIDIKRRERSIVNGTAHPAPLNENHFSHHHPSLYQQNHINGLRSSYNQNPHGGGRDSSSPHNNRASPHHPYLHLNNSPRKDAHSPMYTGEVPGLSPGGNYGARSSMPVPCSSPAQASSASPKGSHSHSPSNGGSSSAGNYSPKLPSGPSAPTELNQLRLYPGFPPPHPSVAAHLSPAFYAAAAAAAASHSIPYPLFTPHYNPHSHSAAASAYLDTFHSALINRGGEMQQRSRSPSPSSQNRYHSPQSAQQQSQNQQQQGSHPSTSVTSLHNKLIESPTVVSSDRHNYNGHMHGHHHHHHPHHHNIPAGQFSPPKGLSIGGPLGISGGIMNLPSSSNGATHKQHNSQQQPENLIVHKNLSIPVNGYHKQWLEHHGLNPNDPIHRKLLAELEAKESRQNYKEMKHRIPAQSPEDMSVSHSMKMSRNNNNNNSNSNISFPSDYQQHPNNRFSHPYAHLNHVHMQNNMQSNHGILTDSNHAKKPVNTSNNHLPNSQLHLSQQGQQQQSHHQPQFLPPSPKKRSGQWNFAVPTNPGNKVELPPPPSHLNLNHAEHIKYLSSPQISNKPSNHSLPNSSNMYNLSSAQHLYPGSPRSGPSTPKSPSVHQVKFSFSSGNSKENAYVNKNLSKAGRNDSSSSSSSNEGNIPWPVEQMPILEAFRRGSLIKLANGELRPVEDLKAEDFIQAAANMSASLRIIHCTVLSIQKSDGNSTCKVTMTVGSQLQNQQVVVPSTPEQPFFVLGRGWSSLSPRTTEKMLQLPCFPLNVGDVCITLSKSTPQSQVSANNSRKNCPQIPKSPSTRGRKPGSGKGAVNVASVKRALQQISSIPIVQKQVGEYVKSTPEPISRLMGPPMTINNITPSVKSTEKVLTTEDMDSGRPSSPKKRRWSAPETESIPPVAVLAESDNSNSQTDVPPREKTPPSAPKEDETTHNKVKAEFDTKESNSPKTDENSNVNVKDSDVVEQRISPDAQSAKA